MITHPIASTDHERRASDDRRAQSDWRAVELALVRHFHERGVEVSANDAQLAIARSLDRFRDVRVRKYVSIFVMRDACEWLRHVQVSRASDANSTRAG